MTSLSRRFVDGLGGRMWSDPLPNSPPLTMETTDVDSPLISPKSADESQPSFSAAMSNSAHTPPPHPATARVLRNKASMNSASGGEEILYRPPVPRKALPPPLPTTDLSQYSFGYQDSSSHRYTQSQSLSNGVQDPAGPSSPSIPHPPSSYATEPRQARKRTSDEFAMDQGMIMPRAASGSGDFAGSSDRDEKYNRKHRSLGIGAAPPRDNREHRDQTRDKRRGDSIAGLGLGSPTTATSTAAAIAISKSTSSIGSSRERHSRHASASTSAALAEASSASNTSSPHQSAERRRVHTVRSDLSNLPSSPSVNTFKHVVHNAGNVPTTPAAMMFAHHHSPSFAIKPPPVQPTTPAEAPGKMWSFSGLGLHLPGTGHKEARGASSFASPSHGGASPRWSRSVGDQQHQSDHARHYVTEHGLSPDMPTANATYSAFPRWQKRHSLLPEIFVSIDASVLDGISQIVGGVIVVSHSPYDPSCIKLVDFDQRIWAGDACGDEEELDVKLAEGVWIKEELASRQTSGDEALRKERGEGTQKRGKTVSSSDSKKTREPVPLPPMQIQALPQATSFRVANLKDSSTLMTPTKATIARTHPSPAVTGYVVSHAPPATSLYYEPPAILESSQAVYLSEYERKKSWTTRRLLVSAPTARRSRQLSETRPRTSATMTKCGDYLVIQNDHLAYRYEVIGTLKQGSFGQVLQCRDHATGQSTAIKIIRNKKRFHHQALVEIKILDNLRKWRIRDTSTGCRRKAPSHQDDRALLSPWSSLHRDGTPGNNLYELIKANGFVGFSTTLILRFTSQMLASLALMRHHRIAHCDLQPENVFLSRPNKSGIKVIDFGSSCFERETVYTYIQSRFYRSPEVILDAFSPSFIPASPSSLARIEQEQLSCIMKPLGVPDKDLINRNSTGAPLPVVNSNGRRRKPGTKTLAQVLRCDDEAFVDFIAKRLFGTPNVA
ncbi:hypothetical protein FRB90_006903 [Tulasnella sp. 427]|nr:hypothetical protein FRB90_006903 [Tulasnella sp. 427]